MSNSVIKMSKDEVIPLADSAALKLETLGGDLRKFSREKIGASDEEKTERKKEVDALQRVILEDMQSTVKTLEALRAGDEKKGIIGQELSLGQFFKDKYGIACDEHGNLSRDFYRLLEVDPGSSSVYSLQSMSDFNEGYRWLVPEIFRSTIRTGLRRNPIYPELIAQEISITQPKYTMPSINMSDAMPYKLNEAQSIPVGALSFNQKDIKLRKVGIGLSLTDEVVKYSSLDVLTVFLQDVGVKLAVASDNDAINTLWNGDQADGSDAITSVGVASSGTLAYADLLKAWFRMGRIGRTPSTMIASEAMAIAIMSMPEFKGFAGGTTLQNINVRTPIPQTQNLFIHGAITDQDAIMFVDKSSALLKLNVGGLEVESERIASKQMGATYVTITTGYGTLFRDARLLLLRDSTADFNAIFDVNAAETETYR